MGRSVEKRAISAHSRCCGDVNMTEGVAIRNLELADITRVARIHLEAFPESALAKLGAEAVGRYYEWLLEGPHEAARLGAFVGAELIGFCFGGIFRGAMSGFLNNNRVFLSSRVMMRPWMISNPIFRDRLFHAVQILRRTKRSRTGGPVASPTARPFGILAIAVNPNSQGVGAGKLLMQRAEKIAQGRGFQEMILTVHPSNLQAIRFYENLRWVRVLHNGDWEGVMKKLLDASPEGNEPAWYPSLSKR